MNLNYIKKKSFEIVVISCMVFILTFGIYRILTGKQGTWSSYIPYLTTKRNNFSNQKYNNFSNKPKSESSGEIECRRVLKDIFNLPFNKDRPNFLKNYVNNGLNLELDCYSPELGLAVEYNGVQHYKFTPFFHKNKESFLNQKYRDELKRRMCVDNGITLIEVPYTIKTNNIESFLISELRKNNFLQ